MINITLVLPYLSGRGGTETVIKNLSRLMNDDQDDNYCIKLYLSGGSSDKKWLRGLNYTGITSQQTPGLIKRMIYISKYILHSHDDVLLIFSTKLLFFTSFLKKILRKKFKIVSWIHFSLFEESTVDVNKLKYADYHLAISSGIRKQLISLGIKNEQIFTIFNPVNRNLDTIHRSNDGCTFIYIGRITFEGQKNLKEMFDALNNVTGNWHLEIYGDGKDVRVCQQYIINELSISSRVEWKGWVNRPWKVINQATALLLTSRYEGMPMVLTEAISRGVYCISSNCPTGPEDIIKYKMNGEIYQLGNTNQLSDMLQKIVNGQPLPDHEIIKQSLAPFYEEKYLLNFKKAIKYITKN